MYRNISKILENWKNSQDHKPLIIVGARQVGKTYSVRAFGNYYYDQMLEINFQNDTKARDYFSILRSSEEIRTYLELNYSDHELTKSTLLFFDEIQLCPELITSLKFLKETMDCDIIGSGSMLGVKLHQMSSWPVGYVEIMNMYPMSFDEFAQAKGLDNKYISTIKECIKESREIPEAIHERFNQMFTDYMVCGGMPEAVNAYVSEGISAAVRVTRRLCNDYQMDIAHYADSKTKIKAQDCFNSVPLQLAKENRKFQYSVVKQGYNARHYEESLNWLEDAGLILKVNRVSRIEKPLEVQKELNIFKVYMFDTGILVSQFDDGDIYGFLNDAMGMYKGLLYENVAAVIFNSMNMKAYYYEPNTSSEIDFIVSYQGVITPVEVKGGLHTKSKSFDNFVKNHDSKIAFRFSKKNVGVSDDGRVRYLPIYTLPWAFE